MAVIDILSATSGPRFIPTSTQQAPHEPLRGLGAPRIVHARSEDGLLTWSYTAGLGEAYNHPEFLLTGLDPFLAESILAHLITQVDRGEVFNETTAASDLLHRLTCAFRYVPAAMASILMPVAMQVADTMQHGKPINALQCVYPDNKNRLPWHLGYNNSWHEGQPIFNFDAPLTRSEIHMLRAAAGIQSKAAEHTVEELH